MPPQSEPIFLVAAGAKKQLQLELIDVADLRLEEAPESERSGLLSFYRRVVVVIGMLDRAT